ncbi:MAG: excalibur calcium-binding domain-containing protein [Sulfuricurvum sp.]|uniref:excalibur calcium-binding domain-containing protein n=1 Tax=Sulfuricurvum sp. TaxID=2025608 RepID=UPI002725C19F|nr:excalibur calcium-binding domain-containing protein [Sulfuricurvum sp.]MDO9055840.1 excalibur calcium-binding domain-containing protein [Sulfuricurvum sp.]MDP3292235.1 excalibur calcium-binding domain-containing protein [Sulfuricurvum sp.]
MSKILYSALFIIVTVSSYAECLVNVPEEIADKIAHGHAWINHSSEFAEKKKIANIEMPDNQKIANPEEFQNHISTIMMTKTPKIIPGNRKVYWDDNTGTIVFYDPLSNDCGTAFRPNDGKEYYERVLMRKESDKDRSKMKTTSQVRKTSNFQCDGRKHCSQMKSCEEATFFLNNCPNTKMDGNNDGIPCEKQWCN